MKASARPMPTPEQRVAADPRHSVWVGASAGSGKTQVLTDRLMRLLLTGVEPGSILCLTYTKAGAAEMAARLFQRLSVWSTASESELVDSLTRLTGSAPDAAMQKLARSLFARALETPGGLKVQTIHAFCERLLQLFPIEAGLSPGFRVLDDAETAALMREAIVQSMEDADPLVAEGWAFLGDGDLTSLEALEKTLANLFGVKTRVRAALQKPNGAQEAVLKIQVALGLVPKPSVEEVEHELSGIDEGLYRRVLDLALSKGDHKHGEKLRAILDADVATRASEMQALFFTGEGERAKAMYQRVWMKHTGIQPAFTAEHDRVEALFGKLWSISVFDTTLAVYRAARNVLDRLDRLKRQRGLYDFDDLIAKTRTLLSSSAQAQWVLYKLDAGLSHVLVDEAQDTSPAQWHIVMSLVDEFFAGDGRERQSTRTVFVVGDRKQSIFSFQGADVSAFEEAKSGLGQKVRDGGQLLQDVNLAVSYRSLAAVLKSVDAVFARGKRARDGYGSGGADEPDHTAERKEGRGLVEIWPLMEKPDTPEPDYWAEPMDRPADDHPRRLLARQIAGEIKSWIGARQLMTKSGPVTVQPGDIMILLQRRNLLFSALIAELRRLGVAVAGSDRLQLGTSIIVADLMMLIQWITLMEDDHGLACILKSPLVPEPLTEESLFALAHGRGPSTLWSMLGEGANRTRLEGYIALAQQQGPFDFLATVSQLCSRDILQRLGSEAEDAIREVLELALDFEKREAPNLAGFAQWFSSSDHVIKREMDPQGGEVRIMTVHGSKGLEAPIVILADAGDTRQKGDPSNLVHVADGEAEGLCVFMPMLDGTPAVIAGWKENAKKKAQQEKLRLLYVGMTRAKDALYVCGVGEEKSKENSKDKGESMPSWWELVSEAFGEPSLAVSSGLLSDGTPVRRVGDAPVFAPSTTPTEDRSQVVVPAWAKPFQTLPPRDAVPRHLARDENTFDSAAARQGVAIHRFFELAPGMPSAQHKSLLKRLNLDAAIGQKLMGLLADPGLGVFFGPESEGEVLISGGETGLRRIDRMARRQGVIHLLDFKSGKRPLAIAPDHGFVRQMADYAALLRNAYPGERVKAALLWTQDGHLDWIPADWIAEP